MKNHEKSQFVNRSLKFSVLLNTDRRTQNPSKNDVLCVCTVQFSVPLLPSFQT